MFRNISVRQHKSTLRTAIATGASLYLFAALPTNNFAAFAQDLDSKVIEVASADSPAAQLAVLDHPATAGWGSDGDTLIDSASSAVQNKTENSTPSNKEEVFKSDLSMALPPSAVLGTIEQNSRLNSEAPLVIDSDEAIEVKETIRFKELPTDDGKTKIIAGAQFPVVLSSEINSKTAKAGDPLEAKLKYDLKIGDRLIAQKGSQINGHLNYVLRARTTTRSLLSVERWYRNSGCLGVSFDEIVNEKGEHIPLMAMPAQIARIVNNKGEGRVLGVNHQGQITGPWSQQLRYKAIRLGLNAAMAPAGVFTFGAMPVALGVIGAANPSFAFTKPVGLNVRHRRIKGFALGFLSGLPGSWLIEDTVIKGQEAIIKPGDELLAEFQEEFTGEPTTDANLLASNRTKVHGQVLPKKSKKKLST